jgi:hypothetical protein
MSQMFEFVKKHPIEVAAPAIHHSIQWIRQWASGASDPAGLAITQDPSISTEAAQLVKQVVATIEAKEGVPAAQLSSKKRSEYVTLLSSTLEQLSKDQLRPDIEKGKSVLMDLRKSIV